MVRLAIKNPGETCAAYTLFARRHYLNAMGCERLHDRAGGPHFNRCSAARDSHAKALISCRLPDDSAEEFIMQPILRPSFVSRRSQHRVHESSGAADVEVRSCRGTIESSTEIEG